jgi:ribA/ribD-fused uncharacterized protein
MILVVCFTGTLKASRGPDMTAPYDEIADWYEAEFLSDRSRDGLPTSDPIGVDASLCAMLGQGEGATLEFGCGTGAHVSSINWRVRDFLRMQAEHMRSADERFEDLLRAECEDALPDLLPFWGPTRQGTSPVGPWVLSQWWPSRFVHRKIEYFHAEGFLMAAKARLFGDDKALPAVLDAENPAVAKNLGRLVQGFDEEVWIEHRYHLAIEGNLAKFSQDKLLRSYLESTAPKVLVEASPRDRIWGIGLSASDRRCVLPSEWLGQNLLGFALAEVRDHLAQPQNG